MYATYPFYIPIIIVLLYVYVFLFYLMLICILKKSDLISFFVSDKFNF